MPGTYLPVFVSDDRRPSSQSSVGSSRQNGLQAGNKKKKVSRLHFPGSLTARRSVTPLPSRTSWKICTNNRCCLGYLWPESKRAAAPGKVKRFSCSFSSNRFLESSPSGFCRSRCYKPSSLLAGGLVGEWVRFGKRQKYHSPIKKNEKYKKVWSMVLLEGSSFQNVFHGAFGSLEILGVCFLILRKLRH